jgi:spermidine synthase
VVPPPNPCDTAPSRQVAADPTEVPIRFPTIIALTLVLSAVGLTYEIAAGRVLAPFFGTSLLTWTSVIATVLGGFSLGNALGGFVAERPRESAVARVRGALVATAVLMAVTPTLVGLLHDIGMRGTGGMFVTVVLVFFPPSVFVTLPSPFLAKVAIEARPGREGSSLGIVLAAGSIGAIFGAILAGFVTLPLIGTTATFAACGAAALLCLPFVRNRPADGAAPDGAGPNTTVVSAAVAFVAFAGLMGQPTCQYESGLSCLHVIEQGPEVRLISDGTTQAAELKGGVSDDERLALPYTQWLWSRLDQDLGPAPSVLFVGGGGYTLPSELLTDRPEAQAVAVEIDPLVTQVVKAHLPQAARVIERTGYDAAAFGTDTGRLALVHADGRIYLNETEHRFDAAVMDAFSSGSVPAHLVTVETYERLREIVDGPIYVNLIDRPDGALARGVHAILRDLYPEVVAVQGPVNVLGRANILLAASDTGFDALEEMPEDYAQVRISDARAFTDDRGWVGHR